VSLVPSAVKTSPAAERRSRHAGAGAQWLVVGCYLLAAFAVTWRLWAGPASRAQVGDPADVDLFAWFLRYDAAAVAHGHLPALVTTAMNAPRGVNLMWNTAFLLPGVVLAPVTLLAGPQASLTVALTLGIAGSAAALLRVLLRWGASVGAAALGGAVYGFSPAVLDSGTGHYHLAFAVAPPLIIDALLAIVTGRGSPVRAGVWLGLLTAAQLFTGEELLADTAVAAVALVAALSASRPRAVGGRAASVASGIGISVAVTLLICGYPLWVQFFGPLSEHNPLPGATPFTNRPSFFVDPSGGLLLHTPASAAAANAYGRGIAEYLGYLGWPLLALLVAAAAGFRRDLRVRVPAVTWVTLELLTLGGGTMHGRLRFVELLLPFHWLQGLPVLSQLLPDRLSILADGAAGAVLAFSLDRARSAAPRAPEWRRVIPAVVAAAAVMPLIPLPYQAAPVPPVPAGWQAAFTRLRLAPGARVLVIPITLQRCPLPLRWQADTGVPDSMIGGYFIGPNQAGQQVIYVPSPATTAARYLDELWSGQAPAAPPPRGLIRGDLAYWRPAAVVAVTGPNSRLGRWLTGVFGRPAFGSGGVLAWRTHRPDRLPAATSR